MLHQRIRRVVHIIHSETGESIQDILQAMVAATHGSVISFSKKMFCAFCGSMLVATKGGPRIRPDLNVQIRAHRCEFCNATFQSKEPVEVSKPVIITEEAPQAIEKPKRNTQNKNRRR